MTKNLESNKTSVTADKILTLLKHAEAQILSAEKGVPLKNLYPELSGVFRNIKSSILTSENPELNAQLDRIDTTLKSCLNQAALSPEQATLLLKEISSARLTLFCQFDGLPTHSKEFCGKTLAALKKEKDANFDDLFTWKQSFETGISAIDVAHRHLLKKFGLYFRTFRVGSEIIDFEAMITEILSAIRLHVEIEECSEQGVSNDHRKVHDTFLAHLSEYESDLRTGKALPSITLFNVIARDFVRHVEFEAALFQKSR